MAHVNAGTAQPYVVYQTRTPLIIDGHLNKRAWELAPKSPRFIDAIGGTPALYDSRAAVLWDSEALYIGFWSEEPFVRNTKTERDSLVFLENDVEVFIDGGDTYYEFEINSLGTVYEVFYIWADAYQRGSRFDVPEFDLYMRNVRTFGGNHDRNGELFWKGSHPRQNRWAFLDWDFPGLQTAVQVTNTATPGPNSRPGWTAELAFPWSGMAWLANGRSLPPQAGDIWRLLFARYELLPLNGQEISVGWTWDRVGSNDNHAPESFTSIQFSTTYIDELG